MKQILWMLAVCILFQLLVIYAHCERSVMCLVGALASHIEQSDVDLFNKAEEFVNQVGF